VAGPRELLRRREFRFLYAARLTSQLADGVFEASLINFVVFNPDKQPDAAGIAGSLAAVLLPFTLVGPFAGIALDRLSRQRVLVVGAVVRLALCLVSAALMTAGHRGADLFTVAIMILSTSRFALSALSAAMPLTLTDADPPDAQTLVTAGSLSTTSGTVATIVGAGFGTGIRTLVGDSDGSLACVAVSAALAYALAATVAARCSRAALGPVDAMPAAGIREELRIVVAEIVDGGLHLWRARPARDTMLAVNAHRLCYGLTFVATILLYRSYFSHPDSSGNLRGLGTLVAASGVGTFLAAIGTPPAVRRWGRHRWVTVNLAVAGVSGLALGLPFRQGLFVVLGLILGFVAQAIKLACDSLVQEEIPDAYRGRAFSTYDLTLNLCYVAASGLGALLLPDDGHSPATLVLISGLYLVTAGLFSRSPSG